MKELINRLNLYRSMGEKLYPEDILIIDDVWDLVDEIERLNKELEQRTKQYENALKRYQDLENQNAQTKYSNKKAIEYIEKQDKWFKNEEYKLIKEKDLLDILKGEENEKE